MSKRQAIFLICQGLAGLLAIAYGAYLIYPPAALVVCGALLIIDYYRGAQPTEGRRGSR